MVFSSHIFLFFFLPVALLLYYSIPRRGKNTVLAILSYIFYGWSNPLFTLLMFFSTIVDYFCGFIIGTTTNKLLSKTALVVSLVTNLGLLIFFKYTDFILESYNQAGVFLFGNEFHFTPVLNFLLPLGISFYTFQSMSYTIDVYRKEAKHINNFIDFSCFVSMFPQLVAGPIIHFQEVATQLLTRQHSIEKFARGIAFFILGLSKKVLIANSCGTMADMAFHTGSIQMFDAWIGIIAYSFQIYFDFSGYSDMAIGLGLMFGFVFPKNFDSPYMAKSITEFWRRWHISLSTWLRKYLYIPLGGNRKGEQRTAINLAVVMLLGGLWHGAAWNFIIWGAIHGCLLGIERIFGRKPFYFFLPKPLQIAITFVLVCIAWVFFRAETFTAATTYLGSMFGLIAIPESSYLLPGLLYTSWNILSLLLATFIVWEMPQSWDWTRSISNLKMTFLALLFFISIAFLSVQSYNPFIYFNF